MVDHSSISSHESWRNRRVLITGAGGFVGRNLVPLVEDTGCLLTTPTRQDYDLLEQDQVRDMFRDTEPNIVFHLAGLVGGILVNKQRPAEFCYQNLLMGTIMLHEAWRSGAEKYVTLIGGCSYPAYTSSPIKETDLWNGYPQPESAPYALAKSMSVLQARAYRKQYGFNAVVLVPGNLYGPHDNFELQTSHVVAALIRKLHLASRSGESEVVIWGTGRPARDFIYVEDACEAIMLAARTYNGPDIINLSSGSLTPIRQLVDMIAELVGYRGHIRWDASKPDGQMSKGFDVTRMKEWLGFECRTSLREGLRKTLEWFAINETNVSAEVRNR